MIKGKRVLITGGTGSFGRAFAAHCIDNGASEVRIFSRDETKQDQMRRESAFAHCEYYLGDVRSLDSIDHAATGCDYLFHAAALKQVPSCEFFPMEAYKTNVIGTQNVLTASFRRDLEALVLLSTDKAVYPVNAMGLSKAMAERLVGSFGRAENGGPRVSATRYGNVLASRGSIVPMVVERIKSKTLKMPITDRRMTRFVMSLEESVELVSHALENSIGGEIYVKRVSACRVVDLVRAVCQIFSTKYEETIIGVRHGEKLHETLVSEEELARSTMTDLYYCIKPDNRTLSYSEFFDEGDERVICGEVSSDSVDLLTVDQIVDALMSTSHFRTLI